MRRRNARNPAIVKTRLLLQDVREHSAQKAASMAFHLGSKCTGEDYPTVMLTNIEFPRYRRVLPRDHTPGALFVNEAGGVAARLDCSAYRQGRQQSGLLVVRSQAAWGRGCAYFPSTCV